MNSYHNMMQIDLNNNMICITTGTGKNYTYPLVPKSPVRKVRPVYLSHRQQLNIPPNSAIQTSASTDATLQGKVWFEPDEQFQELHQLTLSPVLCKIHQAKIPIQIINTTDHPVKIKKHGRETFMPELLKF